MENNYNLINFKVRDKEYIEKELKAFCGNFSKGITIFKQSRDNYYIFNGVVCYGTLYSENHIYRAESLDELKGWLYGMVQANNGYMKWFKGEL